MNEKRKYLYLYSEIRISSSMLSMASPVNDVGSQDSVATEVLSQELDGEGVATIALEILAAAPARELPRELRGEFVPSEAERAFTAECLALRPFPALSAFDTVLAAPGHPLESEHGIGKIFEDEEIVCIFPPLEREVMGHRSDFRKAAGAPPVPILAERTKFGFWVIQQQGQRGCATACMMLRKDHGIAVDMRSLLMWNCRSIELSIKNLREEGLLVPDSTVGHGNLEELRALVARRGSALITIKGEEFGSHVIIVDGVGAENALVREPYHGWQCLVTNEALRGYLCGSMVVQIVR